MNLFRKVVSMQKRGAGCGDEPDFGGRHAAQHDGRRATQSWG